MIEGWEYYNHAAIPLTPPHVMPDLSSLEDGRIWQMNGKRPILAKYETDWDCIANTGWWHLIREAPFSLEDLKRSPRQNIRRALKFVEVDRIDAATHVNELWECRHAAFLGYKLASNEGTREQFELECLRARENGIEYWGGRERASGKLIGFMSVSPRTGWAKICTAKFDPRYLRLRVSDALYATVLGHYLNERGCSFISSGSRSINHVTNTQSYKEEHFGYRKAFCRLHIVYAPRIRWLMRLIYPFRRLVWCVGEHNKKIHLIGALLKMDEIARGDENPPLGNPPNGAGVSATSSEVSGV
ncbi:MAG: hypothetical protein IKQ15_05230 [Kiritimatiellae bacterium]|nr:hypothetical protein [Kiritimatiellia bacterium]